MSDLTKCVNEYCPKRSRCYRATAAENEHRQSYAMFKFSFDEDGFVGCNSFVDDNTGKAIDRGV